MNRFVPIKKRPDGFLPKGSFFCFAFAEKSEIYSFLTEGVKPSGSNILRAESLKALFFPACLPFWNGEVSRSDEGDKEVGGLMKKGENGRREKFFRAVTFFSFTVIDERRDL